MSIQNLSRLSAALDAGRNVGRIPATCRLCSVCLIALLQIRVAVAQADDVSEATDVFCGPRVVHFLLEYFERTPPSLTDLVHTMISSDSGPGSSLQDVRSELEVRGLSVAPIRLGPNELPGVSSPCVIHLRPQNSASLGHFAVLLPNATEDETWVWISQGNLQSGAARRLRSNMSAECLIVGDQAEPPRDRRLRLRTWQDAFVDHALILLPVMLCSWAVWPQRPQRGGREMPGQAAVR